MNEEKEKFKLDLAKSDVETLKERVIQGNEKLYQAFEKIREMVDDKEKWTRALDEYGEASKRLHLICSALKAADFYDCLYIVDGVKTISCLTSDRPRWFCHACPSSKRYWEDEIMKLPRGG